jgi:FkbM family methyltransferase
MKELVKKFLKKRNVYEYFKFSFPFSVYEYVFKPKVIAQHRKEVACYKRFLPACKLIFDIGAYDGHKTAAFLEISRQVVSCEPDPHNFRLLQIRFRNKKKRVRLHPLALSDKQGREAFLIHHPGSAFNTFSSQWKKILEQDQVKRWNEKITFGDENMIEAETTTLDELIRQYGIPDFVKIDVEGYELKVFNGLSQKLPCLSFETLLPEYKDQLLQIIDKLMSLDATTVFNVIHFETLLFSGFVSRADFIEWMDTTDFYSFDVVARTGDPLSISVQERT